ncbi:MAG: anthranilate synthase component I [Gloeomargaritaceae cyanobacterium C42_A2020_066]|nr:anthranilate synthase component I [Gloeomargaritaceae cyanobacterium C42_A2020_066]
MKPWHWRSLPLAERTGAEVFAALGHDLPVALLLESPPPWGSPLGRFSLCGGPPRPGRLWRPAGDQVLPFLGQFPQNSKSSAPDHLPFTGGWLGWLAYEVAHAIEVLPTAKADPLGLPVALWYEPDWFAVLDHQDQTLWLAVTNPQDFERLSRRLETPSVPQSPTAEYGRPAALQLDSSPTEYVAAVRRALAHIRAGDVFQANLSVRYSVETAASPWQLYQRLTRLNPSPFACYGQTPWGSLVSCSPERLVQVAHGQVQTRPIAGTAARGATPAQDAAQWASLQASAKDRAEHIMLVDLARNDLGRVCEWGSVHVDELLVTETYSHVFHLVSNVRGTLRSKGSLAEVIRAVFPGGTITGCPKVRCMEIIHALEPTPRSLFYGSCGYLDQRGHLDLNLLIRTLVVSPHWPGRVWGQVGAGIVADSDPQREWQECLAKAQAQLLALGVDPQGDTVGDALRSHTLTLCS